MYFNVKKPETASKTFRLPLDLLNRLGAVAQQKGVSVNYLVVQCCEYALANLPNGDNRETTIDGGTL